LKKKIKLKEDELIDDEVRKERIKKAFVDKLRSIVDKSTKGKNIIFGKKTLV